jgi:hypothetical protein
MPAWLWMTVWSAIMVALIAMGVAVIVWMQLNFPS